jgi:hypothetical protein
MHTRPLEVDQAIHATLTLRWHTDRKRWMLTMSWRDGERVLHRWQWVDTSAPVDEAAVTILMETVAREMEQWLF